MNDDQIAVVAAVPAAEGEEDWGVLSARPGNPPTES